MEGNQSAKPELVLADLAYTKQKDQIVEKGRSDAYSSKNMKDMDKALGKC